MAIGLDASASGLASADVAPFPTSVSFSLNHAADVSIIVVSNNFWGGGLRTVSTVTVGGASASQISGAAINDGFRNEEVWWIYRASAGDETVVITLTGGVSRLVGFAVSLLDASGSADGFENVATNSGTGANPTASVTVAAGSTGRWIIQASIAIGNIIPSITVGAGQTDIINKIHDGSGPGGHDVNYKATSNATTMQTTYSSGTSWWLSVGFGMKPRAAADQCIAILPQI